MTIIWILVFFVSLAVMLKGAEWFLTSAEKIGLVMGLTPFIVGITIVATGTSLPELISSLFAVGQGATDIVAGNVIGSNIANILLVVGISSIIARKMSVDKDLINLDIPLLATTTGLFVAIAWDKLITLPEAIILLVGHVIYFLYTIYYKEDSHLSSEDILIKEEAPEQQALEKIGEKKTKLHAKDIVFLILGIAGLIFGSQYLVESVIHLSEIWGIATGVIAISAVALGTSLPELLVSALAAARGNAEVALGNIFGSNIFNILVVIGIPALIKPLEIDHQTFTIGLPFLIIATLLFIFSGISRKIYVWEGAFFLLIYVLFIGKLFGIL
jgi:cation:H+ antiporter